MTAISDLLKIKTFTMILEIKNYIKYYDSIMIPFNLKKLDIQFLKYFNFRLGG